MRKRTGYSYVNCRKALLEFGANRLEDAEKWLHNLAVKEGWMKATKFVFASILMDQFVSIRTAERLI